MKCRLSNLSIRLVRGYIRPVQRDGLAKCLLHSSELRENHHRWILYQSMCIIAKSNILRVELGAACGSSYRKCRNHTLWRLIPQKLLLYPSNRVRSSQYYLCPHRPGPFRQRVVQLLPSGRVQDGHVALLRPYGHYD